jgi:hypothetical protein
MSARSASEKGTTYPSRTSKYTSGFKWGRNVTTVGGQTQFTYIKIKMCFIHTKILLTKGSSVIKKKWEFEDTENE